MATSIGKNQYDYLNGLVQAGGGNGEWAKSQLAGSVYAPEAPKPAAVAAPTNNNTPPTPAQTAGAPRTSAAPVYAPPAPDYAKQNADLMSKINSYMSQPVTYDPNSDAAYQAYKQSVTAGAKDASMATLEALNSRGILNSSVTRDDVAGIEQQYAQQAAAAIPQFQQQAYQRNRDMINDSFNLLQNSQNQQQHGIENANVDRNYTAGRQDAATSATGYYTPDAGTIDSVQKQMAANSAAYASASPEEQRRLHEENVRLAATIGGKDSTGSGDYVYSPVRTVQGQQLDYSQQADQRDFKAQEAQRQWDNTFKEGQFDYQKAADLWERNFKDKSFEQSVRQAAQGLGMDYSRMSQSQQQFAAEMAYKYKALEQSANKEDKPSASQNKNQMESEYVSGFDGITPEMRKKAFSDNKATIIQELGLSGYDALYKRYFDEDGNPK